MSVPTSAQPKGSSVGQKDRVGVYLLDLARVVQPADSAVMVELPKAMQTDALQSWGTWARPILEQVAAQIAALPAPTDRFAVSQQTLGQAVVAYGNAAGWWAAGQLSNGRAWAARGAEAWERSIDEAERAGEMIEDGSPMIDDGAIADSHFCPRCFAYSHPYSDKCLACGAPMTSTLPGALAQEATQARESIPPSSYDELLRRVEPSQVPLVRALEKGGSPLDRVWLMTRPNAAVPRSLGPRAMRRGDPGLFFSSALRSMKLRYLGGLPWAPSPIDLEWAINREGFHMRVGPAQGYRIPGEYVLVASPYPVSEQLFNGNLAGFGLGYGMGNIATFTWVNPQIATGQLQLLFVDNGSLATVCLGNRTGLLAPRYEFETWAALVTSMGGWASMAAAAREAEIGPTGYLRELGL